MSSASGVPGFRVGLPRASNHGACPSPTRSSQAETIHNARTIQGTSLRQGRGVELPRASHLSSPPSPQSSAPILSIPATSPVRPRSSTSNRSKSTRRSGRPSLAPPSNCETVPPRSNRPVPRRPPSRRPPRRGRQSQPAADAQCHAGGVDQGRAKGRSTTGRRMKTRPMKGVDADIRTNCALWVLPEHMAKRV
jgi:hypothetical protein